MRILVIGLLILMAFARQSSWAITPPTPNLLRNLDIQRYYQQSQREERVLELSSDQERFIALALEQRTENPQGGLLILHDVGHTPDWPYLLQQVRTVMPDLGWSTLSIDLPTPATEALGVLPLADTNEPISATTSPVEAQARVLARIQAGIAYLNGEGLFNIAVLGYGDGAYWGTKYLSERLAEEEQDSFALILFEPPLKYPDLPELMASLTIPTLDLYMRDSEFAHDQAELRKGAVMRAKHPDYLQIHDAPRHGFYGLPSIDRSTRRIWGWLRNHAAGYEATLNGG